MTPLRLFTGAAMVAALTIAPAASAQIVFDSFDRTDVSNIGTFSGPDGAGSGIGVGSTAGVDGGDNTALSVGINPGNGNTFAGFVIPGPDGTTDIGDSQFLTFYFRPVGAGAAIQAGNLPLTLEINLQEDTDGNGAFDGGGADDEFRAEYRIEMTGTDYQFVEIPLSSFRKTNAPENGNGVLDTEDILQIVPVFGGLRGDEFSFAIDNIGFATAEMMGTSSELPPSLAEAPSVYPNPTAGSARVAFELAQAADVSVEVFDVLGRRVAVVFNGTLTSGPARLDVPTADLGAGTYFVRVRTGEGVATTSLTVVR